MSFGFCSIQRFKCRSVFVQLRDLNVIRFCSIERFKCRSVFVQLRDLNVVRFLFNSEI